METPRLGVVRKSMLTNPILIKEPLGKTRSRGVTGPGPDFIFGISSPKSDGGVAKALSTWEVHTRSKVSDQSPDFVSLNREAVKAGVVTSKEMAQYRVQKTTVQSQAPPKRTVPQQPVLDPDMTFGVKTNLESSTMSSVLSYEFGRQWLETELRRQRPTKQTIKPGCWMETRTSLLRRNSTVGTVPITKTHKNPHYAQVGPSLDTFRRKTVGTQSDLVPSQGHCGVETEALD